MKETQYDPKAFYEEQYDDCYDPICSMDEGRSIETEIPIVSGGIVAEFMHTRNLPELVPDVELWDPCELMTEALCTEDVTEMEIDCMLGETPHYWRYISSDAKDFAVFQGEVNAAVASGDTNRLMEVLSVYAYQFEIAATLLHAIQEKDYCTAKDALHGIVMAA